MAEEGEQSMLTHILPPGHQERARRVQALLCKLLFSPPRIYFSIREVRLLQSQPTWSGSAHRPQLQGRHEAQALASEPILTSRL